MTFYRSRGLDLYYENLGQGHPVLLLHGFSSHCFFWAPQFDALVAAGYRAVPIDLAGHGRSSPIAGPNTVADFAADVVALADALGWETFSACGLSLGGLITQHLIVHHPDRVQTAVVACAPPSLRGHGYETGIAEQVAEFRSENGPIKRLDRVWPRLASERYRTSPAGKAYFAASRELLGSVSGESLAFVAEGALDFDVIEELRQVRMPVLVLAGENDPLFPPPWVAEVAELIPDACFDVITDAQHLPSLERPDQFNERLIGFLREHANSDA